jgi:hypothetical protein
MTSAQWPGHFCRKMCCLNGSKKLHFVQKIRPAPSISKYGQAIIFRTQCDFLLTIEVSTFSGQVSAIEARDAAIFT